MQEHMERRNHRPARHFEHKDEIESGKARPLSLRCINDPGGTDAQLIDRIYESCFAPETWPDVLDEIGRIADTAGASLIVSKDNVLHWVASPEPRERAERFVKEGWLWRGQVIAKLFALCIPGFLIDVDFLTPEELDREPIYRELWRPECPFRNFLNRLNLLDSKEVV
jgi:hypothetical protein